MSWNRPAARSKQYEAPNPSKARVAAVRVIDTRSVMVIPIEKAAPIRNEAYRRWVATLPCIACRIEGFTQAAHPNHGRGLGQKASDEDCFPLCSSRPGHQGCHVLHDQLVDVTLTQRRELEAIYTARTQAQALLEGMLP